MNALGNSAVAHVMALERGYPAPVTAAAGVGVEVSLTAGQTVTDGTSSSSSVMLSAQALLASDSLFTDDLDELTSKLNAAVINDTNNTSSSSSSSNTQPTK